MRLYVYFHFNIFDTFFERKVLEIREFSNENNFGGKPEPKYFPLLRIKN